MKILSTILVVLLIILVLLGAGLQVFLTKGLTTTLNDTVFPAVEKTVGLSISTEHASVNLLKGSANLEGLTVRNLKGYEEPLLFVADHCAVKIELASLLKRNLIVIKEIEASGTRLFIERNKEKSINVQELSEALKPVESAKQPAKEQPAAQTPERSPIPIHIRRLIVDATVIYTDSGHDRTLPLNLRLSASDLFTVPAGNQPDSLVVLRGSLAHDEAAFSTDLNAIVEPITDPAKPSFTATGSILDIDADLLNEVLSKNDMKSGPFSIKPSIQCKSGQLEGSVLNLTLTDLEIYGAQLGDTTLPLKLAGTLQNPRIDIAAAINVLVSEQAVTIGRAIGLKELGIRSDASGGDALLQGLTNSVEEIAESPELQKLIKQVAPGKTTTSNPPLKKTLSNVLFEQLEKNVNEVEKSDADALKGLFNTLLGD